jgi:hypothetical protein
MTRRYRPWHYTPALELFITPLGWSLDARRDRDGVSAAVGPVRVCLLWRLS